MSENKKNRRRGDELQQDIFDSTYKIFRNEGYQAITFTRVASAANTSRSVIYRYWDTPFDLVFDTVHSKIKTDGDMNNLDQVDGIDLRDNLFLIGKSFTKGFDGVLVEFNKLMLTQIMEQPEKIKRLFDQMNTANRKSIQQVFKKAIESREIKHMPKPSVQLLLFQLIRYKYVIENEAINDDQLLDLIDETIMPAVKHRNHY